MANNNMKIESNVPSVLAELPFARERALEMVGLMAERRIKEPADFPVKTGRLRNSITHATNFSEGYVVVGTNVEYAAYVELGTSRQKAHPYMRPGILNHLEEYKTIIKNVLKGGN